jgi:hypothetical protein
MRVNRWESVGSRPSASQVSDPEALPKQACQVGEVTSAASVGLRMRSSPRLQRAAFPGRALAAAPLAFPVGPGLAERFSPARVLML